MIRVLLSALSIGLLFDPAVVRADSEESGVPGRYTIPEDHAREDHHGHDHDAPKHDRHHDHDHDHERHAPKHDRHHGHDHERHGGFSEDEERPTQAGTIYGHGHITLHGDHVMAASKASDRIREAYIHAHFITGVALGNGFSIQSSIHVEGPSSAGHDHSGHGGHDDDDEHDEEDEHDEHAEDDDHDAKAMFGKNRIFAETKALFEELTLEFDRGPWSLYLGKFNPPIDFDYENFPGVYTYQTIEEYTIQGRLGLGFIRRFDGGWGPHQIEMAGFFKDTTYLSDSLITKTGRTRVHDGGVSNTGYPSSFSGYLGGSPNWATDVIDDFYYRIGGARQAAGKTEDRDEVRFNLSLYAAEDIQEEWRTYAIVQYMSAWNWAGRVDHRRQYATFVGGTDYHSWNLVLAHTLIANASSEPDWNQDGHVFQASAGYSFDNGFSVDLGYRNSDEDGMRNERLGIALGYAYAF